MRLFLFVGWLLLLLLPAYSQKRNWYSEKPKFIFFFDNRNSFIKGREADLVGVRLGGEWKHWRAGIGFYGLSNKQYKNVTVTNALGAPQTIDVRLRFGYVTVFGEYIFFRNKRWEFSTPLSIGLGQVALETSKDGEVQKIRKNGIILIEPSITGHFKVFSWVGIGAGVGYRQVLLAPPNQFGIFSSPIYIIKLKIFLSPIYKAIFKKEKAWQ